MSSRFFSCDFQQIFNAIGLQREISTGETTFVIICNHTEPNNTKKNLSFFKRLICTTYSGSTKFESLLSNTRFAALCNCSLELTSCFKEPSSYLKMSRRVLFHLGHSQKSKIFETLFTNLPTLFENKEKRKK